MGFKPEILDNTLVPPAKLEALVKFSAMTKDIVGDVAEVGVYKGGSSYLLCEQNPTKKVYSIDTFEGMPETDKTVDAHNKWDFRDTSLDGVKSLLSPFSNVEFIKGVFPRENSEVLADKKFSLVHLDVDIYSSEIECLNYFWPKMSIGGILVIDDMFYKSTMGATKAVFEFFDCTKIRQVAAGQCYIIKE